MGSVCTRLVVPAKGQGMGVTVCLLSIAITWPLQPTEMMMCGESYLRHFEKNKEI